MRQERRICAITNKNLLDEGYVINDGELYLASEPLARAYCLGLGLTLEQAYDEEIIYWTEFESEDEEVSLFLAKLGKLMGYSKPTVDFYHPQYGLMKGSLPANVIDLNAKAIDYNTLEQAPNPLLSAPSLREFRDFVTEAY
jgi:hypothetical protein